MPRTARTRQGGHLVNLRRVLGAAALLTLTACGATGTATGQAPGAAGSGGPVPSQRAATPTPKPKPKPTAKVIISRFRAPDGAVVTLALFRGPVVVRLHSGSADPGSAALSKVRAGPAIRARERRRLLAAFNSGFLLSAGAGGYEQEGHVISPLRSGLASIVIDKSGSARIGVWGQGLPRPGEAVFSVRQNLTLLVRHGRPTAAAADWSLWGATLGGGELVARSALAENAAGQLIYAGSMSASPADLAAALVQAGARTAMELDINPEWVQLDVARAAGRRLRAAIPGQVRPADQYVVGWTRDFFTILAAG